jgi:surface polysaccharide O-acyltransferase-like enzyme
LAKIDEVKEILNTLRLFFSICIGLIVVITGALIGKEQSGDLDFYFWIGALLDVFLILILFLIVKSIKKNTKIIKDL